MAFTTELAPGALPLFLLFGLLLIYAVIGMFGLPVAARRVAGITLSPARALLTVLLADGGVLLGLAYSRGMLALHGPTWNALFLALKMLLSAGLYAWLLRVRYHQALVLQVIVYGAILAATLLLAWGVAGLG
jgi:hypothetical protein